MRLCRGPICALADRQPAGRLARPAYPLARPISGALRARLRVSDRAHRRAQRGGCMAAATRPRGHAQPARKRSEWAGIVSVFQVRRYLAHRLGGYACRHFRAVAIDRPEYHHAQRLSAWRRAHRARHDGFPAAATQVPLAAFIIVMEMVEDHTMVLSLMACTVVVSTVARLLTSPLHSALAAILLPSRPAHPTGRGNVYRDVRNCYSDDDCRQSAAAAANVDEEFPTSSWPPLPSGLSCGQLHMTIGIHGDYFQKLSARRSPRRTSLLRPYLR